MLETIRDEDIEIHSVVIVKEGKMVLEAYVHPYDRETLHNVKSVSKSVISALVGIALREGVIGGLDETVSQHLPQYFVDETDARKLRINLYNLLTMTSGLDLDENGPISSKIFGRLDWLKATYERPMLADPGTRFLYSTPLTHTMSAIVTEASGMSLLQFADEHLFGPMGFGEVQWRKGPQGYNFGGAELFMCPVDMAKFGYLFLHGGVWDGRPLVPADWVSESTTDKLQEISDSPRYGYWWWLRDGWYYAHGWGGQSISVKKDGEFVAVVTAGDHNAPERLFMEYVVPWLDARDPLDPDPAGVERLGRLIDDLAHPQPDPVTSMPTTAGEISGVRYVLEWNAAGNESFALEFKGDGTCVLHLETVAGDYDLEAGLDGLYRLTDVGTWGSMPEGNRRASRGRWVSERTFQLKSLEMGNPVCFVMDFNFGDGDVEVVTNMLPLGREIVMRGTAE
jgi:CubicO group peptidase (beta-lactamase class C family)